MVFEMQLFDRANAFFDVRRQIGRSIAHGDVPAGRTAHVRRPPAQQAWNVFTAESLRDGRVQASFRCC
jgi:hypothetical protein